MMFELFTERARKVMLAQEEARRMKQKYTSIEHILLGLVSENEGIAVRALEPLCRPGQGPARGHEVARQPGDGGAAHQQSRDFGVCASLAG